MISAVQGTPKSLPQPHNLKVSAFFMVQISHLCMTTEKTKALTVQSFVGKRRSLFFDTLPKFVIAFLPRSVFNFVAAVTVCSDFGAEENKICHCFHFFPIYLPRNDGTGCHSFLMLSFKPAFSLSCFTLLMRPFSSSPLLAIRVVSSAYLIFLPTILIPAWDSSSLAFHMMFSACKLNKLGDNIQP